MALPSKPPGFDNFRQWFFVSADGSGKSPTILASFVMEGTTLYEIYRGANISSVSAANPAVVTTDEPHGLTSGTTVRLHKTSKPGFNDLDVVATVTSSTTFTVPLDGAAIGAATGGIAGVKTDDLVRIDAFPAAFCDLQPYGSLFRQPWEQSAVG